MGVEFRERRETAMTPDLQDWEAKWMVDLFNKDGTLEEQNMPGLLRDRMISILDNNVHVPDILLGLNKNKMKRLSYPRACLALGNVHIIILFFCISPFLNTSVVPPLYQNTVPAVVPLPYNLAFSPHSPLLSINWKTKVFLWKL